MEIGKIIGLSLIGMFGLALVVFIFIRCIMTTTLGENKFRIIESKYDPNRSPSYYVQQRHWGILWVLIGEVYMDTWLETVFKSREEAENWICEYVKRKNWKPKSKVIETIG